MLPAVETDEEWDAVVKDEKLMRAGAEDLCARLGLPGADLTRFPEGSQPVYAVGEDRVLKLFPTAAAQDGIAEGRVLSPLHGLPAARPGAPRRRDRRPAPVDPADDGVRRARRSVAGAGRMHHGRGRRLSPKGQRGDAADGWTVGEHGRSAPQA